MYGLWTTITLGDLELHAIAVSESAKALSDDSRVVDEYVRAVFSFDEAESLFGAEPLHCSADRHLLLALVGACWWFALAPWVASAACISLRCGVR